MNRKELNTDSARELEIFIKNQLAVRGFTEKTITNNRGLIGAVIEEMEAYHQSKSQVKELPSIENLKAQMRGDELNIHQKADALIEFNRLVDFAESKQSQSVDDDFINYLKVEREDFAKVASTYSPSEHNALRTAIDSLLIAYDQATDKLKTKDNE